MSAPLAVRWSIAAAILSSSLGSAGCGRIWFDPLDNEPPVPRRVFGYTVSAPRSGSRLIGVLELDAATGAVTELPAFDLGIPADVLIANPRGTALYALSHADASVTTLSIDREGGLTAIGRIATATESYGGTVDPSGRWLYVADDNIPAVHGYAIGPDETLQPLPGSPFMHAGYASRSVVVEPQGRWLYAMDDTLYGFDVTADGTLAVRPAITWPTMDPDPHAVLIEPSGRHGFIAPDLDGGVPGFTIDPATGALSTTPGSKFSDGANTSMFAAMSPDGSLLFLPDQSGSEDVNTYVIAVDGSLSHAPGSTTPIGTTAFGVAAAPVGDLAVFTDRFAVVVLRASVTGVTNLGMTALVAPAQQIVLLGVPQSTP